MNEKARAGSLVAVAAVGVIVPALHVPTSCEPPSACFQSIPGHHRREQPETPHSVHVSTQSSAGYAITVAGVPPSGDRFAPLIGQAMTMNPDDEPAYEGHGSIGNIEPEPYTTEA